MLADGKGIAQLSLNDDDAGLPGSQAGSSASDTGKQKANPDEEEEADLDDLMPGIVAPSSSSSSTTPAPKRKREAQTGPSSSTPGKEKKEAAASSVKYFEVEGETPEDLAAAYITADVRHLRAPDQWHAVS